MRRIITVFLAICLTVLLTAVTVFADEQSSAAETEIPSTVSEEPMTEAPTTAEPTMPEPTVPETAAPIPETPEPTAQPTEQKTTQAPQKTVASVTAAPTEPVTAATEPETSEEIKITVHTRKRDKGKTNVDLEERTLDGDETAEPTETETTAVTEKVENADKSKGKMTALQTVSAVFGVPVIISVFLVLFAVARKIVIKVTEKDGNDDSEGGQSYE